MSYFLDSHYAAQQMSPFHPFNIPSDHINLPKVGQTRCYWALLSAELQFIHLDPVLAFHLDAQAGILVGQSILRFVHPDERASAKQDLGGVLESRTLHGSVTRVRFSRLSKVRRDLGYDGPVHPWADADKIALDDNYMAVDIVINWAAEGLVLCFIHATADLNPNDNDELNKTDWTNWCGTPVMDPEQTELLYSRLLVCIPRPPTTTRVFQILAHKQGRPLLLSWPPDQDQPPTGREFAALVENVQIGNNLPNGNDAKTSCTRRYRASQPMPAALGPDGGEVESIFIPHGSIIFACHKVNPPVRALPAAMQQYTTANYNPQNHSFYEQQGSYALPSLATAAYSNNYMAQAPVDPNYSSARWAQPAGEQPTSYAQWPSPSPPNSASPLPSSSLRSVSYPPPTPNQQWQQQSVPPAPYIDTVNAPQPGFNRSISPTYPYSSRDADSTSAAPSPGADVVPAPRRRVSPGSSREYATGRGSHRPSGVLKCSSCKTTTSPEWRKGPSGKKELCNACGLRYARSRAKKDPNNSQRRKKDKAVSGGVSKRDHSTPPVALPSPSYSSLRRSFGDASSFTSSAGSASGSDVYSHSGAHGTPSPSPPASGSMGFVHYSPAEGRAGPGTSAGGFYAVPSPLSNPPVVLQEPEDPAPHHQHQQQHQQQQQQQQQQRHMNQLPPLMSGYQDRVSPTLPTQMMAQASFERDRERELPPTPLSAEPRHSRRSILTQQ